MSEFHGPELAPLDPGQFAHLMAVQVVLWDSEAEDLRRHLADVGPGTMRRILSELAARSIPDAVAYVRREILPTIPGYCDHVEDDDGLHCDYCGIPL